MAKQYNYTARDTAGRVRKGVISADTETAAARRLQSMNLAPLSISSAGAKISLGGSSRTKRVKPRQMAAFARQFATMTQAGLPIIRTINALAEETDHPEFRRILPMIRADIEGGASLSTAVAKHPRTFSPMMIGMISAGEASGSLGNALDRIADSFEKDAKLRGKVISAMSYPVIVMGLAMLMVTAMLLFIVPIFSKVFTDLGGQLPLPTRILIFLSGVIKVGAPFGLVGGVFFGIWWRKNKNEERVRRIIDPFKLRIPIMGGFFQKIAISRFSRTFATLVAAGVPLLQALELVGNTAGNIVIKDAIKEVREAVRSGRPMAPPMAQFKVFPKLLTQMIATGEETGSMSMMLDKVADFYDEEVDAAASTLSSTLEPIMIVFLAAIVGGMVVSLYLPIFNVYDLIK